MTTGELLLEVENLSVSFDTDDGVALVVDGVSFTLVAGETLGIVGESGSGKSMTAMAILGILPAAAKVTGSVRFRGKELLGLSEDELREVRGNHIGMVFQDALTALNPVMTVGRQLIEAIRVHRPDTTASQRLARALDLLTLVGIPSPERRLDQYPHEFSGGMRQRVMIGMSMANEPDLLLADEPTTALDVTVQAQILEVLREVQERTGTTIMLITHDLGVIAGVADRVVVMYAGSVVETGPVEPLFYETAHPYTAGLLASMPRTDRRSKDTRLYQISGGPPAATELPPGCRFATRCPYMVVGRCTTHRPHLVAVGERHHAACVRVSEWKEERA